MQYKQHNTFFAMKCRTSSILDFQGALVSQEITLINVIYIVYNVYIKRSIGQVWQSDSS